MSSIGLNQVNQYFTKYDINKDGKMDHAETANASIKLLAKGDADSVNAGELFSTFVQGGQDGKGLFPNFSGSNGFTQTDLSKLAGASGDTSAIESSDFQTLFPNQAQSGGGTGSVDGLQQMASQNVSKYKLDPNNPEQFENSTSSLLPGGDSQNLMQGLVSGMKQIMQMMFQIMSTASNQQQQ